MSCRPMDLKVGSRSSGSSLMFNRSPSAGKGAWWPSGCTMGEADGRLPSTGLLAWGEGWLEWDRGPRGLEVGEGEVGDCW